MAIVVEVTSKRTAGRRRRVTVVAAILAAVVALTAVGWPIYVDPRTDDPRPADAIVVLGGPGGGRVERGLELAERGFAPTVLLSNPYPDPAPVNAACERPHSFDVECFVPEPSTTLGESRYLAARAAEEGWTHVIVVTFTPHITRARDIVAECLGVEPIMVESDDTVSPARFAWQYVYQTAGFVRAAFGSC